MNSDKIDIPEPRPSLGEEIANSASHAIGLVTGMAFFAARHVPYFHFVWHLFVLAGTACHFNAIWRYVV